MATPIQEERVFTQVRHPELIISKFLSEKNISDREDKYLIRSPIHANVHVVLQKNTLQVTTTLQNTSDTEWFMSNYNNEVRVTNIEDHTSSQFYKLNGSNSDDKPDDGRSERIAITDSSYKLFLPGETVTYQFSIAAKEFCERWYRKNVYILFASNDMPPSIINRLRELRPDKRFFDTVINSNEVRVYCYGYDQRKDQYLFDIDNDYL